MDRLEQIFHDQAAYQSLRNKFNTRLSVQDTKELMLLIGEELSEVLHCMGWKSHRKNNQDTVISNIHEELIDVLKYWLILANIWGLSPDLIAKEYFRKSAVVSQLWKQEMNLDLSSEKCICVDIDGVLCDYLGTWYRFLKYKGIAPAILQESVISLDLSLTLLDPTSYESLKREFRESGQKKDALVIDGAQEFLERMKGKYKIVLLSSRPVKEFQRIFADTIEWAESNGLYFDALFFEEAKREWAFRNLDKVAFCIEDSPEQAMRLATYGFKVYLLSQPYNRFFDPPKNVVKVSKLSDIIL